MSSQNKNLAIAITCSDWRLHQDGVHYNKQLAELLGGDGVDLVVIPGPDALYKKENSAALKTVVDATALLAKAHSSSAIAIVGHYQCAGNPASDEQHDKDVAQAAEALRAALEFGGPDWPRLCLGRSVRQAIALRELLQFSLPLICIMLPNAWRWK